MQIKLMKQIVLPIITALLLVSLAGCSMVPSDQDPGGHSDVRLNPRPHVQSGNFSHTGPVGLSGVGDGCVRNVSIGLYYANETKILTKQVGDLCYNDQAPKSKNVTLNSAIQPKYIIIESSDFWDGETPAYPSGLIRIQNYDLYDEYPIEEQGQIKPRGVHSNESIQNHTRMGWSVIGLVALTAGFGLTTTRRQWADD
jgi:hypothetical protein